MKFSKLRKRVFLETGVLVVIPIALSGLLYGLDDINASYEQKQQIIKKEVMDIDAEIKNLQTNYNTVMGNADLLREILDKQSKGMLTIQDKALTSKFKEFQKTYQLYGLKLNASAPQDVTDPKFKRKTSTVIAREVTVDLDTLSDENVYPLLQAIENELPGVPKIIRLSMDKTSDLSDNVLRDIAQKGTYPLVKAEIQFTWYGITPVETPENGSNAAQKPK